MAWPFFRLPLNKTWTDLVSSDSRRQLWLHFMQKHWEEQMGDKGLVFADYLPQMRLAIAKEMCIFPPKEQTPIVFQVVSESLTETRADPNTVFLYWLVYEHHGRTPTNQPLGQAFFCGYILTSDYAWPRWQPVVDCVVLNTQAIRSDLQSAIKAMETPVFATILNTTVPSNDDDGPALCDMDVSVDTHTEDADMLFLYIPGSPFTEHCIDTKEIYIEDCNVTKCMWDVFNLLTYSYYLQTCERYSSSGSYDRNNNLSNLWARSCQCETLDPYLENNIVYMMVGFEMLVASLDTESEKTQQWIATSFLFWLEALLLRGMPKIQKREFRVAQLMKLDGKQRFVLADFLPIVKQTILSNIAWKNTHAVPYTHPDSNPDWTDDLFDNIEYTKKKLQEGLNRHFTRIQDVIAKFQKDNQELAAYMKDIDNTNDGPTFHITADIDSDDEDEDEWELYCCQRIMQEYTAIQQMARDWKKK